VDRLGVGEIPKYGASSSYGINVVIGWNWPKDRAPNSRVSTSSQVLVSEAEWNWFGNLNAYMFFAPTVGVPVTDPTTLPGGYWQPYPAWRHGRAFLADMVFMDGHAEPIKPRRPKNARELLDKTVDTAKVYTWLPGEKNIRLGEEAYNAWPGAVRSWINRRPFCSNFTFEPRYANQLTDSATRGLAPDVRTANFLWKRLSNNVQDRQ
jgi:prepilin-type processing-associated H-X9-DG protein